VKTSAAASEVRSIGRRCRLTAFALLAVFALNGCPWWGDDPHTCTIAVDPEPDDIDAPWQLDGPDGRSWNGRGDETLTDMVVSEYALTWGDVPGFITPVPNPDIRAFTGGDINATVTFAGLYVVDPDTLERSTLVRRPGTQAISGD